MEDFVCVGQESPEEQNKQNICILKGSFSERLCYMISVVQRCLFLYSEGAENLKVHSPAVPIWH